MKTSSIWIGYCSLAVLVALYVVGAVSNGSLRMKFKPCRFGFRL